MICWCVAIREPAARAGYKKKWSGFPHKVLSTNYWVKKKKHLTLSICSFTRGVFRTILSIERGLVTPRTDQKVGFWGDRAGTRSSMEGLLMGHWALFLIWGSQESQESSLAPINSCLCWFGEVGSPNVSRGQLLTTQWQGRASRGTRVPKDHRHCSVFREVKCQLSASIPSVQGRKMASRELL